MDQIVPQLITLVGQAFTNGMGAFIMQSLPLAPSHPSWLPLSGALQSFPDLELNPKSLRQRLTVPGGARDGVAAFLSSALRRVRDAQTSDPYTDFVNTLAVHTGLQSLFAATDDEGSPCNAFLGPAVLAVCRELARVGDEAARTPHAARTPARDEGSARDIRDRTRQALEKTMQVTTSPLEEVEGENVGDVLWGVANVLWRHYAQRKLHTQATELSKTFNGLQPSEGRRLAARAEYIPQTAVAESYYWRGRLGVILLEIRGARDWLEKAWDMCPEGAWQQRRAILIRLIPAALLRGSLPHPAVLEEYGLTDAFVPFIHAFRTGNVPRWRQLLAERREWLRARNIWLLWFERGEILVWRNLFRKALALHYQVPGSARDRCPTATFLAAARAAFAGSGELEDGTLELADIIVVLSSLIDQSIVMGVLAYAQNEVAFRAAPDGFGGFPRIANVTPRHVKAIA